MSPHSIERRASFSEATQTQPQSLPGKDLFRGWERGDSPPSTSLFSQGKAVGERNAAGARLGALLGAGAVGSCNKMSLFHASRIDPCLDSCSPAEHGFLLSLAPSQLDMTGMKIRAVRAEGCKDRSALTVVLDASHSVVLEHPGVLAVYPAPWGCLEHPSLPTLAPLCPESPQGFVV